MRHCSLSSVAPFRGLLRNSVSDPRLAPWASFLGPCGAEQPAAGLLYTNDETAPGAMEGRREVFSAEKRGSHGMFFMPWVRSGKSETT